MMPRSTIEVSLQRQRGLRSWAMLDLGFLLLVARHAELNMSLIQIVGLMGSVGFGCAISVHLAVGYLDFTHLLPAYIGFVSFLVADLLLWVGRNAQLRAEIL